MRKVAPSLVIVFSTLLLSCGGGGGATRPPAPGANPQYLFVANSGDSTISRFVINQTTGELTIAGAATSVSPSRTPLALGLVNNSFLVSANQDSDDTSAFNINKVNGVLTAVAGSPFSDLGGMHNGVAVHPSGKFLYITSQPVGLLAFQINTTSGVLSLIEGSPFGVVDQSAPVIDPTGKYLVTVGFQTLYVYSIDATTGIPTPVPGGPYSSNASSLTGLNFDPSGKFLLGVEGGYLYLHSYALDAASGALAEVKGSPFLQVAVDPWHIVVSGNFAFTCNTTRGTIATWQFDKATGALTWVGEVNAGTFPQSLALDSSKKFLYSGNYRSNNVSGYAINATTGALTELPGSPFAAGSFPYDLVSTH